MFHYADFLKGCQITTKLQTITNSPKRSNGKLYRCLLNTLEIILIMPNAILLTNDQQQLYTKIYRGVASSKSHIRNNKVSTHSAEHRKVLNWKTIVIIEQFIISVTETSCFFILVIFLIFSPFYRKPVTVTIYYVP